MHLLPAILIVCAIASASAFSFDFRSDESSTQTSTDQEQTIFDVIGKTRVGHYVILLCRFLRLLNDQPTSSKYFNLMSGKSQIIQQAQPCIEKTIVESLNDPNNFFGHSIELLRWGETPLENIQQLRQIKPWSIWSIIWAGSVNLKVEQIVEDGERIIRKMADDCLTGDLSKYKDDVDFILNAVETKVMQESS